MKNSQINLNWMLIVFFGLVGSIATTELAIGAVNSETKKAATRSGASAVTEISFSKDSMELSESAKKELQDIISEAAKNGEIKQVRVAAWADQEYPPKGTELAGSQIDLAKKRADEVQSYLEKTLSVKGVSTINMAKRPNSLQETLKTPQARAKDSLENSGAAPTNDAQTGFLGLKGKSSRVVVMVFTKKQSIK